MDILYNPLYWSILALYSLICGTIGYYIGKSKGRVADGIAWGAIFGLAGLIVMSLLSDKQNDADTIQTKPISAFRILFVMVIIGLCVVIVYQLATTV